MGLECASVWLAVSQQMRLPGGKGQGLACPYPGAEGFLVQSLEIAGSIFSHGQGQAQSYVDMCFCTTASCSGSVW
jgi:hypothetical protein